MDSQKRQARIPENMARKLRAARDSQRMRGERRVITMLFSDVTGSTSMAEQLDPEEWAEIMDEAFDFLIAPIYRYEGTLARMMGDGILAFFGAPIAHEDDPQRAVLAGLDIIRGVESFKQEIEAGYGFDFNVRVGINTGPVVVGEIGSDLALEYTAMGDAINLAARMEETALPGTVQISTYTYHLVKPIFDVEPIGTIEIKGKKEPVESYRVIGKREDPGSLRGIEGLNTPMIGRDNELRAIKDRISKLDQANGGIAFLIGEAGLGKSRLIDELQESLATQVKQALRWIESSGVPYQSNHPYGLFQEHIRESLGIEVSDDLPKIRDRTRKAAERFAESEPELVVQAVEVVLSLDGQSGGSLAGAEALKKQLYQFILNIWQEQLEDTRTVAVFDDMHWADASSVELLSQLFHLAEQRPVFFICATRPDHDSPVWAMRQTAREQFGNRFLEIVLKPLTPAESNKLIDGLLSISELPEILRRLISEKADGNPFFVEEVVRSLIDSGIVSRDESGLHWVTRQTVDDLSIPDTIQSLLISRIDRLDKQSKRTLQIASVIGRTFYKEVLAYIDVNGEDLEDRLRTLQDFDLVQEILQGQEQRYRFRHELTREAAYHTILHRERRRYHRLVGEAIEELMPDRIAEESHQLAYHFDEARDQERALNYYVMAGDSAARIYANSEALKYYGRAQEIARSVGTNKQIRQICRQWGRVYEVCGMYDEALAIYQELKDLGEERDDPELILVALMAMATVHATFTSLFDPHRAMKLAEEALDLANKQGNESAKSKIYWIMMLVNVFGLYNYEDATTFGQKSLMIAREYNIREQLAYTLHDLFRPLMFSMQIRSSMEVLEEAGDIFAEVGNLPMLADNRATLAFVYLYMGRITEARQLCEEALRISRATGNLWGESYSLNVYGPIIFTSGQIDEAIQSFSETMRVAREGNFTGTLTYAPMFLAGLYEYLGDYDQGIETVQFGLQMAEKSGQAREKVDLLIARARLFSEMGEPEKAREDLEEVKPSLNTISAVPTSGSTFRMTKNMLDIHEGKYEQAASDLEDFVAMLQEHEIKYILPEALLHWGRALAKSERYEEALEKLSEGHTISYDTGMVIWQLPLTVELARVFEKLGRFDAAAERWQDAGRVADFVASNISDPDLKACFVKRMEVENILKSGDGIVHEK